MRGSSTTFFAKIFRSAAVAQLVEYLIRNETVGGSIPLCGTNIKSSSDDFFRFWLKNCKALITDSHSVKKGYEK